MVNQWSGSGSDYNVGSEIEIISSFKGAQNYLLIKYEN